MTRKCTITVEFKVDGKCPPDEKMIDAFINIIAPVGYIGSEQVDGTDEWGLDIFSTQVSLQKEQ